jgi:hypothetical protein
MSVAGGPNLIKNGLVLELDAGNIKSYPTTGTTWFDKSGNANNGTLTNGPTFNTGSLGSIVFDGSNDYVNCGNNSSINIVNDITVNIWFKINLLTSDWQGILAKRLSNSLTNYGINFNNSSNLFQWYFMSDGINFRILSVPISGNFIAGAWYNICAIFQTAGSNTDAKMYKNGILLTSGTLLNNLATVNTPLTLGVSTGTSEPFNGNISSVQIYNHALTPQEILQNYNATKGRFGL